MKIVGIYSFNTGKEVIEAKFASELKEVQKAIKAVKSSHYKTKVSDEKTMRGKILYDPGQLNKAFSAQFQPKGWGSYRVKCEYSTEYYVEGYKSKASSRGAFRGMDFVKNRVGVEIQFGKYSFMVYNVCAKMTIFHNMDIIDVGIEVVPMKDFADEMSSGVSYFEQFVWDLEQRGAGDIDIPVLIIGITA